jgi:hypothetical protein
MTTHLSLDWHMEVLNSTVTHGYHDGQHNSGTFKDIWDKSWWPYRFWHWQPSWGWVGTQHLCSTWGSRGRRTIHWVSTLYISSFTSISSNFLRWRLLHHIKEDAQAHATCWTSQNLILHPKLWSADSCERHCISSSKNYWTLLTHYIV